MFGLFKRIKKNEVVTIENKVEVPVEVIKEVTCFNEDLYVNAEKCRKILIEHYHQDILSEAMGIASEYNQESTREQIDNDYLIDLYLTDFCKQNDILSILPYDREKAKERFEDLDTNVREYFYENFVQYLGEDFFA